ncbi:GNAT family N-acetyltransferase [Paenibacillus tarimensis]
MIVKTVTPEMWSAVKRRLIAFALRYGDRRLTKLGLQAMQRLESEDLDSSVDGDANAVVAVAFHDNKLVGVGAAIEYGKSACLLAVHPETRGQGIGSALLQSMIRSCGRLSCTVALDNPASISVCFGAGMVAVGISRGPTGKPTIRFIHRSMIQEELQTNEKERGEAWHSPSSVY